MEHWFDVLTYDEDDEPIPAKLLVNVTDEGIILDLYIASQDEPFGSFGATAQELADDFVH